jgi:hypothetical protein
VYLLRSPTRILALLVATCAGTHSAVAQTSTTPLELMVLGSGGPGAIGRAASCYLVLIDGNARILVDAGPEHLLGSVKPSSLCQTPTSFF